VISFTYCPILKTACTNLCWTPEIILVISNWNVEFYRKVAMTLGSFFTGMVKEWVKLCLHSPDAPSWYGAQLKYRDNFTLILLYYYLCIIWWHCANYRNDIAWTERENDYVYMCLNSLSSSIEPSYFILVSLSARPLKPCKYGLVLNQNLRMLVYTNFMFQHSYPV